jgi:hypothetical protein
MGVNISQLKELYKVLFYKKKKQIPVSGQYNASNSYHGFESHWGNWMFVFLPCALLPCGCRELISSENPVACMEDISKIAECKHSMGPNL